mmetsp:Transcript_159348/g.281361  ORF Transcript_159348/g.281361 Transcript_159348/m.281361 type:complete len:195 (+) Transcript_159348:67-651(+)
MGICCAFFGKEEESVEYFDPQVSLHVYDVSVNKQVHLANQMFKKLGTGIYHAGVEVFGREYSFEYADSGTGVVRRAPKAHDCHRYRESIEMGETSLSSRQLSSLIRRMARDWQGDSYNLLRRNCCNFADTFCRELGVGGIPRWVMNLAGAGAKVANAAQTAKKPVTYVAKKATGAAAGAAAMTRKLVLPVKRLP